MIRPIPPLKQSTHRYPNQGHLPSNPAIARYYAPTPAIAACSAFQFARLLTTSGRVGWVSCGWPLTQAFILASAPSVRTGWVGAWTGASGNAREVRPNHCPCAWSSAAATAAAPGCSRLRKPGSCLNRCGSSCALRTLPPPPPPFPAPSPLNLAALTIPTSKKKKTASVFFLLLGLGPISAIGGPRGLPRSQRGWRPQQLGIRAWIRAWSPRCPVPPAPLQPGASGT
jgi:hypothetical protein